MQIKINTPQEAVEFFDNLRLELEATASRNLMGGKVRLDAVPSMPGSVHRFDGSTVTVWYKSGAKATERQLREAAVAVELMGMPRERYTGKLLDIKRGKDGSVYFLCGGVLERRDEANNGMPAFRAFNPSKGQVLSMVINTEVAVTQSVSIARFPVQAGVRSSNGVAHGAGV